MAHSPLGGDGSFDMLEQLKGARRFGVRFAVLVTGLVWFLSGAQITLSLFVAQEPPRFPVCSSPDCNPNKPLLPTDCSTPYHYIRPQISVVSTYDLLPASCEPQPWRNVTYIHSCLFAGILVGALCLAPLSDKKGRRPLITFGVLGMSAAALYSTMAPSIYAFAAARFLVGCGSSACALPSMALLSEITPTHRRQWIVAVQAFAFCVAASYVSILACLVPSWRILTTAVTVPALFFVCGVPCCGGVYLESPKWLAAKGRMEDAFGTWLRIAKVCNIELDDKLDFDAFVKNELQAAHDRNLKSESDVEEELSLMSVKQMVTPDSVFKAFRTFPASVWMWVCMWLWIVTAFVYYGVLLDFGDLVTSLRSQGWETSSVMQLFNGSPSEHLQMLPHGANKRLLQAPLIINPLDRRSALAADYHPGQGPVGHSNDDNHMNHIEHIGFNHNPEPSLQKGEDEIKPARPTPEELESPTPGRPTPEEPGRPTPEEPGKPTPEEPGRPTPEDPSPEDPGRPTPERPSPEEPENPSPVEPGRPTPERPTPEELGRPTPDNSLSKIHQSGHGKLIQSEGPHLQPGDSLVHRDSPSLLHPEPNDKREETHIESSLGHSEGKFIHLGGRVTEAVRGPLVEEEVDTTELKQVAALGEIAGEEEVHNHLSFLDKDKALSYLDNMGELVRNRSKDIFQQAKQLPSEAGRLYNELEMQQMLNDLYSDMSAQFTPDDPLSPFWANMRLQGLLVLVSFLLEIPAYAVAMCMAAHPLFGRKRTVTSLLVAGGIFMVTAFFVQFLGLTSAVLPVATLSLTVVGRCCVAAVFMVLYLYTSEIFPTSIRGSTLGLLSATARIGCIVAAPAAAALDQTHSGLALLVFGTLSLSAALVSVSTLPETYGQPLYDTVDTLEDMYTKNGFVEDFFANWQNRMCGVIGRSTCCLGRLGANCLSLPGERTVSTFEEKGHAWLKKQWRRTGRSSRKHHKSGKHRESTAFVPIGDQTAESRLQTRAFDMEEEAEFVEAGV